MDTIDTSSSVLVTGATGYIAGWLVKTLLEAGVTVHAAVRDPDNSEKRNHLDAAAEKASGKISYFKTDLLDEGSYAEAMEGCSIVFHTASPFVIDVKDPRKELVDPAMLGTRNVLVQATKTPSVERVVLTSSCAAVFGDNADLQETANAMFTEAHWNTSSSLRHNPYFFSKTEAEKEGWKIAESQDRWDLVTINPSLVMGPGLSPRASSESFNIIRQMGDGTMKAGVPDLGLGLVDVRDVAQAHIAAAYTAQANGRYIVSGHNTSLPEMARQLLPKFGDKYPIPRKTIPKFLVWLIGPIMMPGMTRKFIARNVGYPWKGDNTKSVEELGMNYRSLSQTMNDFFQQMVDTGQVREK